MSYLILCISQTTPRICSAELVTLLQKDITEIEKVQRRMTKLVPDLKDLEYEERCVSATLEKC